jgi:hypothetical protein
MKVSLLCSLAVLASAGSPVQKVVELLGECKAKVLADVDAEKAAMTEYTSYCDDEAKEKAYAIKTATSAIEGLSATVESSTATIAEADDEMATLGTLIADKEKELSDATAVRKEEHDNFVASEKELIETVDQLGRAATVLKKGMSLAQTRGGQFHVNKNTEEAIGALSTIIESQWLSAGSKRTLQSFLQSKSQSEEDDDLSFEQPQAKSVAYESASGGIVQAVEDMQGKAEDTLSEIRKKETEASHGFQMVDGGLMNEIENAKDKLAAAGKLKADSEQKLQTANGEMVATTKTKGADESYLATLKSECQARAVEFEEAMKSAKDEVAAITKASTILSEGVTAFIQLKSKTHRASARARLSSEDSDDDSDAQADARDKVVSIFKGLANDHHSFVFSQLASMAAADPFEKIKGLINDMIEKLLKEAQEAATHEAFCQEEMGKTKKSREDKEMKLEKFTSRVDKADSKLGELTQAIKTLTEEVGEIDKATAEATAIRTKENEEFRKVSKDYKDSATAVAQAIEVLQNFYSGASFLQLKSQTRLKSKSRAKSMTEGNGDAASVIIGVLETAQEDFTSLLAETEATESEAQQAFDTMATENKIAKATKMAEAKAKESERKGVASSLEMSKEDQSSTGKELDAVLAYLDKLKPECETKAMSYEEKKAARDAEIEGLKEALSILSGTGIALMQTGTHHFRRHA